MQTEISNVSTCLDPSELVISEELRNFKRTTKRHKQIFVVDGKNLLENLQKQEQCEPVRERERNA